MSNSPDVTPSKQGEFAGIIDLQKQIGQKVAGYFNRVDTEFCKLKGIDLPTTLFTAAFNRLLTAGSLNMSDLGAQHSHEGIAHLNTWTAKSDQGAKADLWHRLILAQGAGLRFLTIEHGAESMLNKVTVQTTMDASSGGPVFGGFQQHHLSYNSPDHSRPEHTNTMQFFLPAAGFRSVMSPVPYVQTLTGKGMIISPRVYDYILPDGSVELQSGAQTFRAKNGVTYDGCYNREDRSLIWPQESSLESEIKKNMIIVYPTDDTAGNLERQAVDAFWIGLSPDDQCFLADRALLQLPQNPLIELW